MSSTRVTKIDARVNIALVASGMGTQATASANEAAASTLRWWHDAGIDVLIDETPRNWLAQSVAAPHVKAPTPPPVVQSPKTRAALVEWMLTDGDIPDAGPPKRRVAPSGDPASDLMILTDLPDAADIDSGVLLSGELAPLFDKMLAALKRDRNSVYLASLCPGRPPSGRLSDASLPELTKIARAHIGFVAPKRLWVLGASASRAVLGMSDVAAHGKLHTINLDEGMIDVVATAHPRFLTDMDKKRRAWTEMQRLMEKEDV